MRLGIIGCSDIAYKRFMPAVEGIEGLEVVAVAEEYDKSRVKPFCEKYGLQAEENFERLLARNDLDAVYVPQPPALHYEWAKKALVSGKHVLVEKPSTTEAHLSLELSEIARERGLALHENYMFAYHAQIDAIRTLINDGAIGDVRCYRASFGFPLREAKDFRYNRSLGGGALLDAGGYTVKLATLFLGEDVRVEAAVMSTLPGYEVDMYGSVMLTDQTGGVFQAGFGMDNNYSCAFSVWGSRGTLTTGRIFTAPEGYTPSATIERNGEVETVILPKDSHFRKSVCAFMEETEDTLKREKMYNDIIKQAQLIDDIRRKARRG